MVILKRTKKSVKFNTGRPYSLEGQIIVATLFTHNDCQFVYIEDISRGLEHIIKTDNLLPDIIMRHYDECHYVNGYDILKIGRNKAYQEAMNR